MSTQQEPLARHANEVKDMAKEAANIGAQAVVSGVYFYPIEGIYHLIRHPYLWKPLVGPLTLGVLTSLVVTSALFFWTYIPQAAFLTLSNGPFGFIAAVPVVLGESATITLFIARMLWLAPALDNTFDAVLLEQGHTALVSQGREIRGAGKSKRVGKALSAPLNRFSKEAIVTYIISLPLNAIPVVGTVFFLFYNGYKTGPNLHARYFQLKRLTNTQRRDFISQRRGEYTALGTASMALNLVPGASILFAFTTAVGAALWASDLEKQSGAQVDTNASDEATQDVSHVARKIEPDHKKLL